MLFKSRSERTLDEALASLDQTRSWSEAKINAGTLTDEDRERVREELNRAAELEERSRGESTFTLFGPELGMLKRFFREGRSVMTDQQYLAQSHRIIARAEEILADTTSRK